MTTTAEVISHRTKELLTENEGLLFGQCVTAVGWVGGTIPQLGEDDGIVELSMADVAGASIAVGAALSRRRCIYVIRYQGFLWYNAASIVNYAAKSKYMWNVACPLMIRAISMDGSIGPVASSSHHGMVGRMPGLVIAAPMTPKEWNTVFDWWLEHDEPVFVSESRKSFAIDYEFEDVVESDPHVTIIGVGASRMELSRVLKDLRGKNINVNLFHQVWLKPYTPSTSLVQSVRDSRFSLVVDSDFEDCSIAKTMAYELMHRSGKPVHVLGLEERSSGFSSATDNATPSRVQVVARVLSIINSEGVDQIVS